jgi:Ca-activated chloride channel family protein
MPFSSLRIFINNTVASWRSLRIDDLQFWHRADARLWITAVVGLVLVLLIARTLLRRQAGRHRVVLPALLTAMPRSRAALLVHLPVLLFLAGLAFFAIALADPYSALVRREASFPGRRICLMVDASTSMRTPFTAASLNRRSATDAAFFTTVAAAERFVRMRMKGQYRDLLALVEFGNEAYVVTPFTHDYENILLSIGLIGDPIEFSMFPDQGTIIGRAIEEGTELFKAFNFLEASGNIMVIFSDGEDTRAMIRNKPLDDILQSAIDAKVPVYLVRANYDRGKGQVIPDELWIPAVEKTGGKFFAASDEKSLLNAISEIDKAATGRIDVTQYSSQQPEFTIFALIATLFWTGSAGLKLVVPYFQKMP